MEAFFCSVKHEKWKNSFLKEKSTKSYRNYVLSLPRHVGHIGTAYSTVGSYLDEQMLHFWNIIRVPDALKLRPYPEKAEDGVP